MATSPLPPPDTPKATCINFGMCCRVLDLINHAKFQLDRFRIFRAPGGRKSNIICLLLPLCIDYLCNCRYIIVVSNSINLTVSRSVLACAQMRHVNPSLQSAEPMVRRAAYMAIAVSSEGCADHIRNKSVLLVVYLGCKNG